MGWRKRKRRHPLKHWYRRHAPSVLIALCIVGAVVAVAMILVDLRDESLATPSPVIE